MERIKLRVSGNQIQVTEHPAVITAGTVGLEAEFFFDSQWEQLTKTAVFKAEEKTVVTTLTQNAHPVPWEVLQTPNQWLCIGVYGANRDGTVVIPTLWAKVSVIHTGVNPEGDPALEPTAPIWQEALAKAELGADAHREVQQVIDGLGPEICPGSESPFLSDILCELVGQDGYLEYTLYEHTDNRENPHNVTCQQIGAASKEDIEAAVAGGKGIVVTVENNVASHTNKEIFDTVLSGRAVYLKMWSGTYVSVSYCTETEAVFEGSYAANITGADGKSYGTQMFRFFNIANNKLSQVTHTIPNKDYIDGQIQYYLNQ